MGFVVYGVILGLTGRVKARMIWVKGTCLFSFHHALDEYFQKEQVSHAIFFACPAVKSLKVIPKDLYIIDTIYNEATEPVSL